MLYLGDGDGGINVLGVVLMWLTKHIFMLKGQRRVNLL